MEIKSRIFGHRLISTPFCEYGGPVVLPETAQSPLEIWRSLHSFAESIKKQTRANFLEYRTEALTGLEPQDLTLETSAIYRNFTLKGGSSDLWERFDRKLRNIIRKSTSLGITVQKVESPADLSSFYKLYLRVQTRRGSPVHRSEFFETLLESKTGEFPIFLARMDSEIVSAIIAPALKNRVDWWININEPKHRHLNATSLLLWNLIKIKSENHDNFSMNLGRTRSGSPIYDFKRQWSGSETTLFNLTDTTVKLSDPDASSFRFASKIWSVLPLSISKRIGPRVIVGVAM